MLDYLRGRQAVGSTTSILSDDFGGTTLDLNKWDIYDGGLGAVSVGAVLVAERTAQAAIGTGITGITHSVSSSALNIVFGTTPNAEKWFLSKIAFAGAEDITIILNKSQALAENSFFVGVFEVDPWTGLPLLNTVTANEFSNRGGVDYGKTTNTQQAQVEALGNNSPAPAIVTLNPWAPAAMTTAFETTIEVSAEDIFASSAVVDSASGKQTTVMRVSSQCPDDTKLYKLIMRARNIGTPASSTTIQVLRSLVNVSADHRVEIKSGRGDQNLAKSVPTNIVNSPISGATAANSAATQILGATNSGAYGALNIGRLHVASAVTGFFKATFGRPYFWVLTNTSAGTRYVHLYNKATAPTLTSDTPVLTIPISAGQTVALSTDIGLAGFNTNGIAYAITTDDAAIPATGATIGDVQGIVGYL